ncbi:hypothetical protein QTP88_011037 [Uroleucon formosanum]
MISNASFFPSAENDQISGDSNEKVKFSTPHKETTMDKDTLDPINKEIITNQHNQDKPNNEVIKETYKRPPTTLTYSLPIPPPHHQIKNSTISLPHLKNHKSKKNTKKDSHKKQN